MKTPINTLADKFMEVYNDHVNSLDLDEIIEIAKENGNDYEQIMDHVWDNINPGELNEVVAMTATNMSIHARDHIIIKCDTQKQMDMLKEFCEANNLPIIE